MNKTSRGFTVIELIIVIVVFALASVIFFVQKNNIEVAGRDERSKTAINAMYYGLEEVYVKKNGSYPLKINEAVLPSVDPDLFKDSNGVAIGESDSKFRYEPVDCSADACKGYTLRADLENEDDYIKSQRETEE